MPIWDDNQLDDQPVFDLSTDFRGGMNTTVLPHLLLPTQYAKGFNVLLTKTGRLRTRGGLTAKAAVAGDAATGLCYYETTGAELILMATDDGSTQTLTSWNNTASAPIAGYSLTKRVSAFQGQSLALFFGDSGAEYYNGTTLHKLNMAGLPVITAGGTGYVVGDILTLTTAGTADIAATVRVKTVGGSGDITEVEFTSTAAQGRGYSLVPNGYTGGTGSSATFTYSLVSPADGNIACWHTERVFKNDTANPDTLKISDILEPQYFPSSSDLTVGSDGEPITGVHSWDNFNLLVFKANSVYIIETNPLTAPNTWRIEKISGTIGCVSHWTATQVGADVWWLAREGVQSVRRLMQETQREITDAISTPVQSYLDVINWKHADKASMCYYDNKVFLAFPTNAETDNDSWLVFDTYHKVWVSEWSGAVSPNLMIRSRFDNKSEFYVATPDGDLRVYDDIAASDTDITPTPSDITSYIETRAFNFRDPISSKSLINVELEFFDSLAKADLAINVNGLGFVDIQTGLDTGTDILTLSFTLPATLSAGGLFYRAFPLWRYRSVEQVQWKLTATSLRLALRGVKMAGFLEPMELER